MDFFKFQVELQVDRVGVCLCSDVRESFVRVESLAKIRRFRKSLSYNVKFADGQPFPPL